MKVAGTLRYEKNGKESFGISFDDGMIIRVHKTGEDDWSLMWMVSAGPDSYYLTKKKWPKGKNLEKRINLGVALIKKNINNNRYRIKKPKQTNE